METTDGCVEVIKNSSPYKPPPPPPPQYPSIIVHAVIKVQEWRTLSEARATELEGVWQKLQQEKDGVAMVGGASSCVCVCYKLWNVMFWGGGGEELCQLEKNMYIIICFFR